MRLQYCMIHLLGVVLSLQEHVLAQADTSSQQSFDLVGNQRYKYPLLLALQHDDGTISAAGPLLIENIIQSHSAPVAVSPPSSSSNTDTQNHQQRVRRRQQEELRVDNTTVTTAASSISNSTATIKAFYYFIQALGRSDSNGCKHPQPSFTATCPQGAFIVAQSSKFSPWKSRLNCEQASNNEIKCQPQKSDNYLEEEDLDDEDQNGVIMACYGEATDADAGYRADNSGSLQVSVQVDAEEYFCDKALNVTSSETDATVVSGGHVYQTVAMQKQCWSQGAKDESWIFVEPTCGSIISTPVIARLQAANDNRKKDMLQRTDVTVQFGDDGIGNDNQERGTPITAVIAHCSVEDNCSVELECSSPGRPCYGKSQCNVTMPGFITTSTSITTSANPPTDCLPRDFATDVETGEACDFNVMCSSGVCAEGVCAPDLLAASDICEEDSDCASSACGKYPHNATAPIDNKAIKNRTCCPSGVTFGHEGISFCTESQPVGASCHQDVMCETGMCVFGTCRPTLLDENMECEEAIDCLVGHCGYYHDESVKVCCPTGNSIDLSNGTMCSNRPSGDVCENGVNSLCTSNVCVENVCGAQQVPGGACDNHFDCINNACALESADPSAPYICCPTGGYVFLAELDGTADAGNGMRICTGQPDGASCSEDHDVDVLCESGMCIGGTCRATRNAPGEVCVNDEDCENLVCAESSLDEGAAKICCPSNDHKHVYVPEASVLRDICTGQPQGAQCGHHNIDVLCESGSCISGVCQNDSGK